VHTISLLTASRESRVAIDPSEIGLKNKAAVLKEAKAIAAYHLGQEVKSARECALQGMFSLTVIVRMKNHEEYVVQLRSEIVHEENSRQAHEILGDIVPIPTRVIVEGSPVPYAYIMPFIPGSTWVRVNWTSEALAINHVKVAGQIGEMIGKCCMPASDMSNHTIDTVIVPRLKSYLDWDEPAVMPYKDLLQSLLDRVDELRKLPSCWTHYDINMMNVIVSEDGVIRGILDWEESYWMPLGVNTCRIVELAANNNGGKLSKKSYSDDMEEVFWKALFQTAPPEARGLLDEIQLAMDIGFVMDTFFEAKFPPHPSHVGVLDDALIAYRVPKDLPSLYVLL
jgi:Phosphotransferase enzyme family